MQLPLDVGSQSADHLIVAMNSLGDLYAVWNSPQIANPNRCAAEGVLLRYHGGANPYWDVPAATDTDILGHYAQQLFTAASCHDSQGNETCLKPVVVAVGEDFLVAWPRIDLDASGQHRPGKLECVLIDVDVTTTGYYTIRRPAPNRGYLLPEDNYCFEAGNSGETISLARRCFPQVQGVDRTGVAVLVNIHQVNNPGAGFQNDYVMHGFEIDFSGPGAPVIHRLKNGGSVNPENLLEGILVDEVDPSVMADSGRVPPFAMETKDAGLAGLGQLLISHEMYDTRGASPVGNLQVHWLEVTSFSGTSQEYTLTEQVAEFYYSLPTADHQRRSNLATNHSLPTVPEYGFAWQTIDPLGEEYRANLGLIRLLPGLTPDIEFIDRSYPNPGPLQMRDPRTLYGPGFDVLLLVDDGYHGLPGNPNFRMFWWDWSSGTNTELPPGCVPGGGPCTNKPRRPSYALVSGFDLPIAYDATVGSGTKRYPILPVYDL